MEKTLLTTKQLAEALQVAPITVYRWRKEGMPVVKLSERVFRYNLEAVIAWRKQQTK